MNPSDIHRHTAARFRTLVEGTTDWEAPTPVDEWMARDVVRHLLEWFPPFLQSATGVELTPQAVDEDPPTAWMQRTSEVQALLDSPNPPAFDHPRIGPMPFDHAVDRFYTVDIFMHSWDLARATGQDDTLDPDRCEAILAGMEPMEGIIRASGQYGSRVNVPPDAGAQDRLIGFIGRDPNWRPRPDTLGG